MYELLYISQAVVDLTETEMEAFLGRSRERNAQADITGILLHIHDGPVGDEPFRAAFFVQSLEGPQEAVEQTYERIRADMLHTDLTVVHRGQRESRSFAGWRMHLTRMTSEAALALIARESQPDSGPPLRSDNPADTFALLRDPLIARALLVVVADQSR
ncbi:hypothetical protein GCM10022223_15960 [Kineosporia mesophila]|uniref:BLUF domain-containing protein n=1 Tax=Kineosporia mesophila TaxID=566012 RepID=A0ABP6Z9D4_9ACTN|nr:BLUF domain-containing protein [Kineosporia mesophila]MCD5354888.1 BLUF domain-containing protein [Kineosporia mesophila]